MESQEDGVKHPYQEKEPLAPHPGGVNPETGEIGGPKGPEPTRYGDWERKGRVTDFWFTWYDPKVFYLEKGFEIAEKNSMMVEISVFGKYIVTEPKNQK